MIKVRTFLCTTIEDMKYFLVSHLNKNPDRFLFALEHGTIIRTGITRKKICCYMRDSACRWLIVENAKIFRGHVKHS